MTTDDEILGLLGRALTAESSPGPRDADVERLRAIAAQRQGTVVSLRGPSQSGPRLRQLAAAAAVAAAFTGGMLVARDRSAASEDSAGVVEFRQDMVTTDDGRVDVLGRRVAIGRIVEIRSDAFRILPTGEFYEVWFVAAGDTPATPKRISAGTFHPDLEGRTAVAMTAAVDPVKYPILVITAETADGDPRPSRNEVMRGSLTVLD